jgi:hypothetical protein
MSDHFSNVYASAGAVDSMNGIGPTLRRLADRSAGADRSARVR